MRRKIEEAETTLESLVEKAKMGDKDVLEEIILRIQDNIYGLAIRMLFIPADAEDATQEILVKVITHLGTFRGESRFDTWVYRIATNHLLTMRKSRAERWKMTFDVCLKNIDEQASLKEDETSIEAEQNVIEEEAKHACIHFLMLCLSRELRIAFILGEIFGVTSREGAEILEVTPAAYRQRLSRGRKQIMDFLLARCGEVDLNNPCSCRKQAVLHVKKKIMDPEHLFFAHHPCHAHHGEHTEGLLHEFDRLSRAAALIRKHPRYAAPDTLVETMKCLIDSRKFKILSI
jgi:RNA polymerase sigma factor (sigma-70 family)